MGYGSVNALKVTSVVGQGPDYDDEFQVTRHSNRLDKTSGGQQVIDHGATNTSGNRSSQQ